jgi:hypothetical protein
MLNFYIRHSLGFALSSAFLLSLAPEAISRPKFDHWDSHAPRGNAYGYWKNRQYRTVRSVPSHCQKRVIGGRTFYYDNRANYYYRYNPERRAYVVVDAIDLASFIKNTFF